MGISREFEIGEIVNGREITDIRRKGIMRNDRYIKIENIYDCLCINCWSYVEMTHASLLARSRRGKTEYCVHCRQKEDHELDKGYLPEYYAELSAMPISKHPIGDWRY